jgi:hypothetical protein
MYLDQDLVPRSGVAALHELLRPGDVAHFVFGIVEDEKRELHKRHSGLDGRYEVHEHDCSAPFHAVVPAQSSRLAPGIPNREVQGFGMFESLSIVAHGVQPQRHLRRRGARSDCEPSSTGTEYTVGKDQSEKQTSIR